MKLKGNFTRPIQKVNKKLLNQSGSNFKNKTQQHFFNADNSSIGQVTEGETWAQAMRNAQAANS